MLTNRDGDPGGLVGSGSRYFGWIRIRVFWTDQDPGVWSDQDPGGLVGSASGWFVRISIRVVWSDQDPGGYGLIRIRIWEKLVCVLGLNIHIQNYSKL